MFDREAAKRAFLRINPPRGGVDPQPDPKPDDKPDLTAEITKGVTTALAAGLPEIVKQIRAAEQPAEPVQVAPRTVAALPDDVADEEFDKAVAEGRSIAPLLRKRDQRRDAIQRREMDALRDAGGAAIGSAVRQAANSLQYYSRYKNEIDSMVAGHCQNTGAVPTYEMYENAHKIVQANHITDLVNEGVEEKIRKAKAPEDDFSDGSRTAARSDQPKEASTLSEVLGTGDWQKEFRAKSRAFKNRTDDGELRAMGYQGLEAFKERRKRLEVIDEETNGTLGLDRDWDRKSNSWREAPQGRRGRVGVEI